MAGYKELFGPTLDRNIVTETKFVEGIEEFRQNHPVLFLIALVVLGIPAIIFGGIAIVGLKIVAFFFNKRADYLEKKLAKIRS